MAGHQSWPHTVAPREPPTRIPAGLRRSAHTSRPALGGARTGCPTGRIEALAAANSLGVGRIRPRTRRWLSGATAAQGAPGAGENGRTPGQALPGLWPPHPSDAPQWHPSHKRVRQTSATPRATSARPARGVILARLETASRDSLPRPRTSSAWRRRGGARVRSRSSKTIALTTQRRSVRAARVHGGDVQHRGATLPRSGDLALPRPPRARQLAAYAC